MFRHEEGGEGTVCQVIYQSLGIANVSSFCSSQGSCRTASPHAVAAVGPGPAWVLLLLGPQDTLGTKVPQGGGIAPLRAHVERPALRTRLFGSAQDPACCGGTGLCPRDPSAWPPRWGFSMGKASGIAWSHRRQGSGPGSLAVRVPATEMPVAHRRVQWPPPAHNRRAGATPPPLYCPLNSDAL